MIRESETVRYRLRERSDPIQRFPVRLRVDVIGGIVCDPRVQLFEKHVTDECIRLLRGGLAVPRSAVPLRAPLLPCGAIVEVEFLGLCGPYRAEQREGKNHPKYVATPVPECRHQSRPMEQSL